jgi:hypothetical protein
MTDRCIPLATAAYGTWMARPAKTTTLPPGGDDSQLDRRVRPVLGEPLLVGKSPEGLAAAGAGDSNSTEPVSCLRGQEPLGSVNCEFRCAAVTAGVRWCTRRMRPSTDRLGFRSRPIADASGAPVLRDQGPIVRPGSARPIQAVKGAGRLCDGHLWPQRWPRLRSTNAIGSYFGTMRGAAVPGLLVPVDQPAERVGSEHEEVRAPQRAHYGRRYRGSSAERGRCASRPRR